MTVKIITLGCKVNQYESQAMLEALLAAGFTQAAPDEAAGVVVVNSCTVTAQSDHKVRQALRRAKKDNPGAVTVLTGCMPQAFPDAAAALLEADIVLAEPRALIGFAGPRVIEQTIRAKLPEGFQRAEFLLEKGFVDAIVPRNEQKKTIAHLIRLHERRKEI